MLFRKTVMGLLCGLGITLAASAAQAAESDQPIYAEKGEQTCLKCHDSAPVNQILQTPHAVKGDARSPFAQHGCESCHGASPEHVASRPPQGQKRAHPAVVFNGPDASPISERNKMCLTCHEEGMRMNWIGSKHATNEVACSSCHTVHVQKDPVLVKATQPEKCFTCHAQQRAESFEFSHHPVREGKVVCSDCHNPHGSPGPKLLKEFTLNETCYNCHADKRGPMLWEHEPVRENCDSCHTPHGSTQARLLKERPPFLCTQCHQEGGHQSAVFSYNVTPGGAASASQVSQRMLARGCLNCHPQIHGSNSPSGSVFNR